MSNQKSLRDKNYVTILIRAAHRMTHFHLSKLKFSSNYCSLLQAFKF